MAISIAEFRLSFVWACPFVADKVPGGSADFLRRAGYEKLFASLQGAGSTGFSLPWPKDRPYAHKFWVRYLDIQNPSDLPATNGWQKAVPFRLTARVADVASPWKPGRLTLEVYVYPFGVGFIATFAGSAVAGTKEWAARALAATAQAMAVTFAAEGAKTMALPALATECFIRAGTQHFASPKLSTALADPFVIATVIRGDGVNKANAPASNSAAHRFLYAAATLRKNWDAATLDKLVKGKTLLETRGGGAPGDVVFATKRGRGIWFPSAFTESTTPVTSLSCYHRNQVFGALQVESLCEAAQEVCAQLKASATVSPRVDEFGRMAATQLSALYRGDASSYRSISLRRQIDDRDALPDIKTLAKRYGLPAI